MRALVQRMEDFHRLLEVTLAPQNLRPPAHGARAHIYLEQSAAKISGRNCRGDISGFAGFFARDGVFLIRNTVRGKIRKFGIMPSITRKRSCS